MIDRSRRGSIDQQASRHTDTLASSSRRPVDPLATSCLWPDREESSGNDRAAHPRAASCGAETWGAHGATRLISLRSGVTEPGVSSVQDTVHGWLLLV
jgi:hypothetical protein